MNVADIPGHDLSTSSRIDEAINTYLQQAALYYFTAPTSGVMT